MALDTKLRERIEALADDLFCDLYGLKGCPARGTKFVRDRGADGRDRCCLGRLLPSLPLCLTSRHKPADVKLCGSRMMRRLRSMDRIGKFRLPRKI